MTDPNQINTSDQKLEDIIENLQKKLFEKDIEINEYRKKLVLSDQQKEEFISMAAHELRAPTTAIKGYLSMVLDGDTGDISDRTRGYLTDAQSTNERLIRLVNNMINVSRIEQGKIEYSEKECLLSELARVVFNDFKLEAERKNLKYNFEVQNGVNDRVVIDQDRVQEVITNLLSNAVKYTSEGFITLKIFQCQDGAYVRLEVCDSGPGISLEEKSRLFQKFYRVESTAGKTIGTGLGLYISKLIISKFKGNIGIESEEGKGSTFWFELPVVV